MNEPPELLTRAEAAAFCRCSVSAFDAHVRPQLPKPKQVGRKLLFRREDLEAWAADGAIVALPAPVAASVRQSDRQVAAARLPLSARQRAALLGAEPPPRASSPKAQAVLERLRRKLAKAHQ